MTTPRGDIPQLQQGQSAQYTTVNDAIEQLTVFIPGTGGIIDWQINNDPGGTIDGDVYIVGDTPTGAWSAFSEHDLVYKQNGAWYAKSPIASQHWVHYLTSKDRFIFFDLTEWRFVPTGEWILEDAITTSSSQTEVDFTLDVNVQRYKIIAEFTSSVVSGEWANLYVNGDLDDVDYETTTVQDHGSKTVLSAPRMMFGNDSLGNYSETVIQNITGGRAAWQTSGYFLQSVSPNNVKVEVNGSYTPMITNLTSLKIKAVSGNFVDGSKFTLYKAT